MSELSGAENPDDCRIIQGDFIYGNDIKHVSEFWK